MATIIKKRLKEIEGIVLLEGSHDQNEEHRMCIMEAVAFVAGESWTDSPQCACPVISAFLRNWNDSIKDDATRTRLLSPLIPKLVDTKASARVETLRSEMALDWLIRTHTVAWLRNVPSLVCHADALASLPEVNTATAKVTGPVVRAAGAAARAAAGDAAWDAARDAAGAAARAAARDAAGAAARDALQPTVEALQLDAVKLVERMIQVGE